MLLLASKQGRSINVGLKPIWRSCSVLAAILCKRSSLSCSFILVKQCYYKVTLFLGNAYQTVTIVPTSEVNQSGEVSYVLIVSPPDEDKNAADLSVYDFKEEKG